MNLTIRLILAIAFCVGLITVASAQRPPNAERITNGPVLEGTGDSWAEVAWTTDTGGSTVVHYGTDRNHLTKTAEAPYSDNEKTKSQNHRVRLTNLQPGTTYYYRVDSGQGEGTGTDAMSPIQQFTTKGGASVSVGAKAERITNGPVVEATGSNWAEVAWTTDAGGSSIVRYGTDRNKLGEIAESRYSRNATSAGANHRVRIQNLQPNTTYYFVVDSGQGQGTGTNATSNVSSFRTKG